MFVFLIKNKNNLKGQKLHTIEYKNCCQHHMGNPKIMTRQIAIANQGKIIAFRFFCKLFSPRWNKRNVPSEWVWSTSCYFTQHSWAIGAQTGWTQTMPPPWVYLIEETERVKEVMEQWVQLNLKCTAGALQTLAQDWERERPCCLSLCACIGLSAFTKTPQEQTPPPTPVLSPSCQSNCLKWSRVGALALPES